MHISDKKIYKLNQKVFNKQIYDQIITYFIMCSQTFNNYDKHFFNLDLVENSAYIYLCEQMLHNYGI